ncbi:hypothetical protein ILUMI_27033, partial [Ignelater luminosus]
GFRPGRGTTDLMCTQTNIIQSLISTMFFYREISKLAKTTSERGKRLNLELIREHQKQTLMPDSVLETVNKKVKILPSHGSNQGLMHPLASQRIFVLDDAIEIEDKNNVVGYSRIDKPLYRAHFEESREHRGYVKLNVLEASGKKLDDENRSPSVDSAISTTSSKSYVKENNGTEDNVHEAQGNDSGYSNSESTYDYRRITAARIPKKLSILEKDIYTEASRLPSKCIIPIEVKNEDIFDSDSEEEMDEDKYKKKIQKTALFRTIYYMNSTEFMDHFRNNTFPNTLARYLGFTDESINQATSISDAIFCDTTDEMFNVIQWEIIPSVAIPWPITIANERVLRCQVATQDRTENILRGFKWPTSAMVQKINKLNCVVIPKGFMPKKGNNSNLDIEWEIGFPKAERYLELTMSHAQMRVFLYILIIHRHFIEPFTQKHGLSIDHIRTHMFWECENNYLTWPEHRLGTKLRIVLKSLYERLSKSHLPHYFIHGKNLLENIPRKYLIPAQDIIYRILETPLPYILMALKHVRYAPGKFYPEPDIEQLYEILVKESVLPHEANITILSQEGLLKDKEARRNSNNRNKKGKRDKQQEWNRRLIERQRIANARRLMKIENEKNLNIDEKESKESVTFNFSVKKRLARDIQRQSLLLTFFIQHFLQIGKRSLKVASTSQTLFYLKQAWYLTKLLEDIELEKETARYYQRIIKEEEERCQIKQVKEPKVHFTPKRNSSLFASEILQVKGRQINIERLNQSYLSSMISNEPRPSTSGIKKKVKKRNTQSKVTINEDENVIPADSHLPRPSTSGINKKIKKKNAQPKATINEDENVAVADIHEPKPSTSGLQKKAEVRFSEREQTEPIEIPKARSSISRLNKQMHSEVKLSNPVPLMNIHEEDTKEVNGEKGASFQLNDYTPNFNKKILSFNSTRAENNIINLDNGADDIAESTSL